MRLKANIKMTELLPLIPLTLTRVIFALGGGEVVHLAGDDNDGLKDNITSGNFFTVSGVRFNKALVKIDDFLHVASTSKAKKNNGKDRKLTYVNLCYKHFTSYMSFLILIPVHPFRTLCILDILFYSVFGAI